VFAAPASAFGAVITTPSPATPAGSIGLRLIDEPVTAGDDPRARVYIVDHLAPGAVIHRRIEVSNTTASTVHTVLYPAAASIAKGSFLGAPGHTPNDLSTWTSVAPGTSDIRAGGRATATVTIAVPRDAAPGEQYGVVWAEARSTPAAGGGVTQVSRVGVRLYLSIGPGGSPAANFTIDSLTAKRSPDGQPIVLATVHNTGGRALDMSGTLQLSDGPGGLSAGPFPATLGITLAIGDTEPVTIALDKQIPDGPWNARITLHSGLLERSARVTITFPATGTSPAVHTTASRRGSGWVIPAIAGVVVLLLATAAALVMHKNGRRPTTTLAPDEAPERLTIH
jgi:hypothetical protein